MSIAITLHLLAAVIWVGGMFFAHQMLRPVAAELLQPPLRQPLWVGVFGRFFPWVWAAVITIAVSGYWMLFGVFGGFANVGIYVHVMHGLGLIMIAIYLYVFFSPYQKLKRAVAAQAWPEGKGYIDRIRDMVGINMILGLITIAVGAGGRYLAG
jgi:uncharacterized membrane protein